MPDYGFTNILARHKTSAIHDRSECKDFLLSGAPNAAVHKFLLAFFVSRIKSPVYGMDLCDCLDCSVRSVCVGSMNAKQILDLQKDDTDRLPCDICFD